MTLKKKIKKTLKSFGKSSSSWRQGVLALQPLSHTHTCCLQQLGGGEKVEGRSTNVVGGSETIKVHPWAACSLASRLLDQRFFLLPQTLTISNVFERLRTNWARVSVFLKTVTETLTSSLIDSNWRGGGVNDMLKPPLRPKAPYLQPCVRP